MKNTIQIARYAILGVVMLALSGCGVPKSEHQALADKYSQVQKENDALKTKNKDLEARVTRLSAANKTLQTKHQKLMDEKKAPEAQKTEAPKKTE